MDNSFLMNLSPCSHPNMAPSPLGLGSHGLCNGIALQEEVQGLGCTAHHGGGQAVGEEVWAGTLAEQIDEGFRASCIPTCRWRKEKWRRYPRVTCSEEGPSIKPTCHLQQEFQYKPGLKKSQLMPFTKSFHLDPKGKCMGKMTVEGAHGRTSPDAAAGSQTEPHATSRRGQHAFVALSLGRGRKHQSNAVELFRARRALDRKMPSPAAPPRAFPRVELMMVTLSITPSSSSVPL